MARDYYQGYVGGKYDIKAMFRAGFRMKRSSRGKRYFVRKEGRRKDVAYRKGGRWVDKSYIIKNPGKRKR